ncbi:glycosyltransferase family 2 protein [Salidesulfovibrio onnuriiensis]|uniref:glycosyltransferase family 2 protein n=1 Tax=Salidesulfovibrio onnuriiensis TaxID=2583823 RepID=UPI0011C86FC4|nr:glycosyltransferase family 2 protein [Salidesulfovibrio onnuriiensis]
MSNPKISVTMPCYNCEDTVGRALDSLLDQTVEDFEVVAVDDGSTDGTAGVLRDYARRDDRIRPVLADHGGVVAAANTAMEAATGEYVVRMDADDESLPERLEHQAALMDDDSALGLVGCRVRFGGCRKRCAGYAHYVDWTNTLLDHEAISLNRFVEFPVPNPSIMFRRSMLEEHGGYRDGDFPEDYELLLRWLERGVRMAKADAELLVWNDPPTRLSRNHPKYDVDAFYRIKTRYLARWLERNNPHHPVVHILGAGRTSRKRADLLKGYGVEFAAYYDLDPRKIGHRVHGIPVLSRDEVPGPGRGFCLSYVATRGARRDIADFLDGRGCALGRDYLPVA